MRVVGGEASGRRLIAPPGRSTRPTTDSVREAIFNILGSMGVSLEEAGGVDPFSGSGAPGIEALSPRAAPATFVDSASGAVGGLKANIEAPAYRRRGRHRA